MMRNGSEGSERHGGNRAKPERWIGIAGVGAAVFRGCIGMEMDYRLAPKTWTNHKGGVTIRATNKAKATAQTSRL